MPGPPGGAFRILVVDDDEDNRELFQLVLVHAGYDVVTASGGREALARLSEIPTDLALLDVMMQDMNGFDLAEKIRANPAISDVRILMVTALDDRHVRARALGAGADDLIHKPVSRHDLCTRVAALLTIVRWPPSAAPAA